MNEHEVVRLLLPAAASSDIQPEDLRRVREHLARCEACRRVSGELEALVAALRKIHTPQPRPELLDRVRALAEPRLADMRPSVREWGWLAALVLISWMGALATWPLLRAAGEWAFAAGHAATSGLGSALAAYSLLGLLPASISAFAVALRTGIIGRTK